MTEYAAAPEVEAMAQSAIRAWHPHLSMTDIRFVFRDPPQKKGGQTVWAAVRKATPMENHLCDAELVLVVAAEVWRDLGHDQRLALLDHELCHVVAETDAETGEITYGMRGHDLEEFHSVARRHGAWRDSITVFRGQLDLFEHATHNRPPGAMTAAAGVESEDEYERAYLAYDKPEIDAVHLPLDTWQPRTLGGPPGAVWQWEIPHPTAENPCTLMAKRPVLERDGSGKAVRVGDWMPPELVLTATEADDSDEEAGGEAGEASGDPAS